MAKVISKDLNKFLNEWVKDEEVKKHINTMFENELHKILVKWAKTGKIKISQCKHKTLAGFSNADKVEDKTTICLECGVVLPAKIKKNA